MSTIQEEIKAAETAAQAWYKQELIKADEEYKKLKSESFSFKTVVIACIASAVVGCFLTILIG